MFLKGTNPQPMGPVRAPWAGRVDGFELSAALLPTAVYWTTIFHTAIERGRPNLAGEALSQLLTMEAGLLQKGATQTDLQALADAHGVDLNMGRYEMEKQAYVQALAKGDVGEWSPVDDYYPGYVALRRHYYRRRPLLPTGVPPVHAPTMANEARLSVGDVLSGARPRQPRFIRTSNMPAPSRKVLGYLDAGFHNQWWQRKVVGDQVMPEHRRGDIIHWRP